MREYGKVFSQFWGSEDIRALSDDGRTLALYLLTCQHGTIAGVFPLPDGYICEDIRWSSERVSKGFAELFEKGFAYRCQKTNWVWITKHFEWNRPENPNQWKAARKIAARVPDKCSWKADFIEVFDIESGAKEPPESEPFTNPSPTLSKPVSETETETEGLTLSKGKTRKPAKTRLPPDFTLTSELATYATAKLPDCDPASLFEQFAGQARAKGWEYVDWPTAFQVYCRNARKDSGHFSAGQYPRRSAGGVHAGVVMR